eukprot:1188478-Prorocentrum_minimum.AAC.1
MWRDHLADVAGTFGRCGRDMRLMWREHLADVARHNHRLTLLGRLTVTGIQFRPTHRVGASFMRKTALKPSISFPCPLLFRSPLLPTTAHRWNCSGQNGAHVGSSGRSSFRICVTKSGRTFPSESTITATFCLPQQVSQGLEGGCVPIQFDQY